MLSQRRAGQGGRPKVMGCPLRHTADVGAAASAKEPGPSFGVSSTAACTCDEVAGSSVLGSSVLSMEPRLEALGIMGNRVVMRETTILAPK